MKIYKGCWIILLVCLMANLTYAQAVKPIVKNEDRGSARDIERKRINDLTSRENDLHLLDRMREFESPKEETERIRKEEIIKNLKQLRENNEKLFSLTRELDEKSLKDTANLANKLAKASKGLRRYLELKGKKDSDNYLETSLSNDEKIEQIRELASKVNDLVSEVSKAQTIGSVDASQIDETEANLQEIESNANKLKQLAGKK